MDAVDIHEVEAHLSTLVEKAAKGDAFVIVKGGKPMVKVVPLEPSGTSKRRVGFLKGVFTVPDDVKAFGREEVERMFQGPAE